LARLYIWKAACVVIIQHRIAHFDGQPALAVHRVAGIDGQIQQHLLQLMRIGIGIPKPGGHLGFQFHRFAQHALQHVIHAAQHHTEIDNVRLQRMTPGKASSSAASLAPRPTAVIAYPPA
jgi:hypothetical protein